MVGLERDLGDRLALDAEALEVGPLVLFALAPDEVSLGVLSLRLCELSERHAPLELRQVRARQVADEIRRREDQTAVAKLHFPLVSRLKPTVLPQRARLGVREAGDYGIATNEARNSRSPGDEHLHGGEGVGGSSPPEGLSDLQRLCPARRSARQPQTSRGNFEGTELGASLPSHQHSSSKEAAGTRAVGPRGRGERDLRRGS
jgi:hypothetical protein